MIPSAGASWMPLDSFPFYKAQIAGEVMLRRLGGQEIPRVLWTLRLSLIPRT